MPFATSSSTDAKRLCQPFWTTDPAVRHAQAVNSFTGTAPRYLIESLGMVMIAALAYSLSLRPEGLSGAAPVLGALAIGAQKLMPQTATDLLWLGDVARQPEHLGGRHCALGAADPRRVFQTRHLRTARCIWSTASCC